MHNVKASSETSTGLVWFRRAALCATALAFIVVAVGAWVRLTDAGLGCPENHRPGAGADLVRHDVTSAIHNDGQHRARLVGESEVPARNPWTRLLQVIGREANRCAAQRVGRDDGQTCPRSRMIGHPRAESDARDGRHAGQQWRRKRGVAADSIRAERLAPRTKHWGVQKVTKGSPQDVRETWAG